MTGVLLELLVDTQLRYRDALIQMAQMAESGEIKILPGSVDHLSSLFDVQVMHRDALIQFVESEMERFAEFDAQVLARVQDVLDSCSQLKALEDEIVSQLHTGHFVWYFYGEGGCDLCASMTGRYEDIPNRPHPNCDCRMAGWGIV